MSVSQINVFLPFSRYLRQATRVFIKYGVNVLPDVNDVSPLIKKNLKRSRDFLL